MRLDEFDYLLPEELIAQYPAAQRTGSRLLIMEGDRLHDGLFPDLLNYLQPNDCLIFNNTRVMPARLYGLKPTGGKVEILVERLLTQDRVLCHLRSSKSPKPGALIYFGEAQAEVLGRQEEFYILRLLNGSWLDLMNAQGELPLPPYMCRSAQSSDIERYQTVYNRHLGAVAAPTAGLHFDQALLDKISALGISFGFVTLHVGAGTFLPIRADNIADHKMHSEWAQVPQSVVDLVRETRERGGRVFAVGTTSVRSLETAARSGQLEAFSGDTNIFIYPGVEFRVVDGMITNFHLPKSTLIMLVSAFMGKENIFKAYEHAVDQKYRFFSYGDAMLLIRGLD